MELIWIVTWLALCFAVAAYAGRKGLDGTFYFLVSFLLSPLVGGACAWAAKPDREKAAKASGLKKCPDCAEFVQQAARKCRFCGHEFPNHVGALRQACTDRSGGARAARIAAGVVIVAAACAILYWMVNAYW